MTTNDVVSPEGRATRQVRRAVTLGAVAAMSAMALVACSPGEDVYVDGWWDNGDVLYAPVKSTLFDEEGVPRCDTPTVEGLIESRARAFSENGGVSTLFMFEIINPELDPNEELTGFSSARDEEKERTERERRLNSLDQMYQWTHPDFDAKYGISEPADLADVKAEIRDHLDELEEPVYAFMKPGTQWIQAPEGRFSLTRISDVVGYLEQSSLDFEFDGLNFRYQRAIGPNGDEYLLFVDRESGESALYNVTNQDDKIELDENAELFEQYDVFMPDTPDEPSLELTLVNDQCPPSFGANVARYWVYDYELFYPEPFEPVELI